jgi:hypothetical protein
MDRSFAFYLIHPDPAALIERLKPIFAGAKGKQIAIRLIAMKEARLIAWADGETTKLLNSMRSCFGDIGRDKGIFKYLADRERGKNTVTKREDPVTKKILVTNLLSEADINPFVEQMKKLQ